MNKSNIMVSMKVLVYRVLGILFVTSIMLLVPNLAKAATYTVTSTANAGAGTLRQAIIDANGNAGADTIEFNIAGAGPHTITPTTYLPDITDQVTIDGLTQPNASCGTLVPATLPAPNNTPHNLLIELDATNLDGPTPEEDGALRFVNSAASNSIVRGVVVNRVNNSVYDGVMLRADVGETLTDVLIECNYIGTDPAGTMAPGGLQLSSGILHYNNGGTVINITVRNNLISGMVLGIQGSGTALVENNLFGTDATGSSAIGSLGPNIQFGSAFEYSGTATVRHNIVGGGTGAGASGISQNGVENMIIDDNYVGVDITGTVAIPNESGITGAGFAPTTITNNLVSGNNQEGLWVYGGNGVSDISNNRIGVDVNDAPLGNAGNGITIEAYSDSQIDIHNNTIANNGGSGIDGTESTSLPSMTIYDNIITSNQIDGIRMENSDVEIRNNTISLSNNAGINAPISATGLIIDQNTISDIAGHGLYINWGSHTITDNTVSNSGASGMVINGSNNQVTGNQSTNNSVVGIEIGGSTDTVQNNQATNNDSGFNIVGYDGNITGNIADSNTNGFTISGGGNNLNNNQAINNTENGIELGGSQHVLTQNYIGVTNTGVLAANQGDGIFAQSASSSTIGGSGANDKNYISGNGGNGIHMFACGADVTQGLTVIGNYIGTNLMGEIESGYGNGGSGIQINEQELFGCGGGGGTSIFQNTIGGDTAGEQNVIAGNNEDGIRIFQAPNMDVFSNTVLPNVIFGNANLGINLAADTDNDGFADADLGPNPLNNDLMSYPAINANYYLNRPTINTAQFNGNQLTINYDFQANQADNSSLLQSDVIGYRLDFYINDSAQDGAYAGYNQSKAHIGSFIVDGSENGANHVFTTTETLDTTKSINATATVLWKSYTCPNADDKSGNGPPYDTCGGGGGG